jgi:hypothetical protein
MRASTQPTNATHAPTPPELSSEADPGAQDPITGAQVVIPHAVQVTTHG